MAVRFADHTVEIEELVVPVEGHFLGPSTSWALLLVTEGTGSILENGRSYPLALSSSVLVPAGAGIQFLPVNGDGLRLGCVEFAIESVAWDSSLGARLAFRQAVAACQAARVLEPSSPVGGRLKIFLEQFASPTSFSLRDPNLAEAMGPIFQELRSWLLLRSPSAGETPERILNVLRSVGETNLQDLSVAEMAKRCGCSRRHLSRLVREHFGSALVSVRTELRLDKAALLLRSHERKIIDVAMDCGFSHLGLFTTKFRERFGMTPGQWRKQLIQDQSLASTATTPRSRGVESMAAHPPRR